jgi:hypothetical protein
VAKIKSEEDLTRERQAEDERKKREAEEDAARQRDFTDSTRAQLLAAFANEAKPSPLPTAEALGWEPDVKKAAQLAAEAKKIVLTFSVVGELKTGHC